MHRSLYCEYLVNVLPAPLETTLGFQDYRTTTRNIKFHAASVEKGKFDKEKYSFLDLKASLAHPKASRKGQV